MNADQRRWKTRAAFASICVLALAGSLQAGTAVSPRDFVQGFYTWYTSAKVQKSPGRAWDVAVKERSSSFSPDVVRQLRADSLAQDKSSGDIVGLDFDPFLYSQDPAQRYVVSGVTAKGAGWLVDVDAGKKSAVVAEIVPAGDGWQFINFHYGDGQDLIAVLKTLREDREKSAH